MKKYLLTGLLGHKARVVVEAKSIEDACEKAAQGEFEVLGEQPEDNVTFTRWAGFDVAEYMGIDAEVHTDDYAYTYEFDAAPWFEMAHGQEILDLAKCDWGGDVPADQVAIFTQKFDARLEALFSYLTARNKGTGETVGFECHVSEDDAKAWLAKHRPDLAEMLERRNA